MDVDVELLEAFLNRAWNNAKEGANTLPEQLLIEQQNALNFIASGSLSSVSKNSAAQGYSGYNPGSLTQRQITRIFTTLIRYYQVVKDKIICEAAEAVVDLTGFDFDQSVYDLLIKYFQVSTSADVLPDITELRFPKACIPLASSLP